MVRSSSMSPFFYWLIRLRISLLAYVESWLNEAQPNSGHCPSGPPGPPAPSPLSIPIPSDLLPSLHPGLEAWDRLHLFARCRRNTAPIWEKCVPDEVWGRRTKKSRRLLRWKWIQIQFQCDSFAGRRPGEWRKRRGKRSKTRTADCVRHTPASRDWLAVKPCCCCSVFRLAGYLIACFYWLLVQHRLCLCHRQL